MNENGKRTRVVAGSWDFEPDGKKLVISKNGVEIFSFTNEDLPVDNRFALLGMRFLMQESPEWQDEKDVKKAFEAALTNAKSGEAFAKSKRGAPVRWSPSPDDGESPALLYRYMVATWPATYPDIKTAEKLLKRTSADKLAAIYQRQDIIAGLRALRSLDKSKTDDALAL